MKKIVRYNGETLSYYPCTKPTELVIGDMYEVIHEGGPEWQPHYILKGINGYFTSAWFEKVPTIMAVAKEKPKVREKYQCSKLEFLKWKVKRVNIETTPVQKIISIGEGVYCIRTKDNIYIVHIN